MTQPIAACRVARPADPGWTPVPEAELAHLRLYWGRPYEVGFDAGSGQWLARRPGSGEQIIAGSAPELRRLIRDAWNARQHPGRGGDGGAAEDAVAVFRSVSDVGLGMGREVARCVPGCVLGCEGAGFSLMFWAVAGQVRAVREFVRLALAGHPAADDAVAVASELAANSVAHSGSGLAGGMFTVHVIAMGQDAAGLAVTELRGSGFPQVQDAGPDADSGRGLQVVEALTSLFWWSDDGLTRILFATVPAPGGGQ